MRVLLIEGLFYKSTTGFLMVETASGERELVAPKLGAFLGEKVSVLIHHKPPPLVDPEKWGGGCCHWQPAECPAGHHKDPAMLLHFEVEGILQAHSLHSNGDPSGFEVLCADGHSFVLPLKALIGHDSRLVFVEKGVEKGDSSSLTKEVEQLQETLRQIQSFTQQGKT